jgi:K(+)-stimulated pyrophosphate-energized sodium pump
MIKVVNMVSLIAAPIIVKYSEMNVGVLLVAGALLVAIIWAISTSSRPAKALDEIPSQSATD